MESQRPVLAGKVSVREPLFVGARRKTRTAPDHSALGPASDHRSGSPHNQNAATEVLWTTEDARLWCVSMEGRVPCNTVLL